MVNIPYFKDVTYFLGETGAATNPSESSESSSMAMVFFLGLSWTVGAFSL